MEKSLNELKELLKEERKKLQQKHLDAGEIEYRAGKVIAFEMAIDIITLNQQLEEIEDITYEEK